MKRSSPAGLRLQRQYIAGNYPGSIRELAGYMGAIQAQDYAGAKWAMGLRVKGIKDAEVDAAMASGDIVRTHVLRPTWHFVHPADIKWMLQLSAKRINQACATYNKKAGLDTGLFNKCNRVLEKTLRGTQLTRHVLAAALHKAGIATDELRLVHILMRAEIDGIICSGGREGKQFTYALLDERLAGVQQNDPADALAELALRYFTSHGPATVDDFAWWGGLNLGDARKGLEAVKEQLVSEDMGERVMWMSRAATGGEKTRKAYLLPAYDEYTVAYKDRGDILEPHHAAQARNGIFNPVVVVDGKIAGTWQRKIVKGSPEVTTHLFDQPSATVQKAIDKAIDSYIDFLGSDSVIS